MKYDIFISYKRRGTSSATAAYLYELLLNKGYNVFFDRKELRSGMFDEQLLAHISDAKDVIILLEDSSLAACYNTEFPNYYQSDWFCKEVMHALSLPGKNVVPILLEGYKMPSLDELPEELKDLTRCQALNLEISEIEEFYEKYFIDKEYLKSKPTNISQIKRSRSNKAAISNLLFTYEGYCYDIIEYGDYIGTIDENNDDNHPYRYGVDFAGEHKILCINNDTCERIVVCTEVAPYYQKYISIEWKKHQLIWEFSESDINKEEDPKLLFEWGKGFFEGTRTHWPNHELSFLCFEKAIEKHSSEAEEYFKSCWTTIFEKMRWRKGRINTKPWIELAAKLGDVNAYRRLGGEYMLKQDYTTSKEWYKKAIKEGDVPSMLEVATYFSQVSRKPFTLEDITNGLVKDLPGLLLKIKELANGEELFKLGRLCQRLERKKMPILSSFEIFEMSASKGYGKAYIWMGHRLESNNDYEGAINQYNNVKEGVIRIEALSNIARCLVKLNRYEEAKQNFEVIINETNNDSEESEFLMDSYLGLAKIYRDGLAGEQNINKALKMFEQISDEDSWDGEYEIALANMAILYETQPELDTLKAAQYYEKLSKRLYDDTNYSLNFYGGFEAPQTDVCFAIAHASTNGISWDKDYVKALRYYAICMCDYSFMHYNAEILNIINEDIRILFDNMNYSSPECLRNVGFIYYELFGDSQKAYELLKLAEEKEDENATDIMRIIKIEENGKKKDEKRLRYYLSKSKNTYRGIKDFEIFDYFISPYGEKLARDVELNKK